jgi:outer membrane protein
MFSFVFAMTFHRAGVFRWGAAVGLAGLLPYCAAAQYGALKIRITGAGSDAGRVRLEVFPDERSYAERAAAMSFETGVTNGAAEFELQNLGAQRLVLRAYHDENDNGKLDRSPLGVPEEAVGFSNRARSRFGPPSFQEAAIEPAALSLSDVEIHLQRALSTDWQVGVGIGVIGRQSPYVGGGYQVWPIPNIVYAGRRFSIFGPRAAYLFAGGDWWKINAIGQVRFNALDPDANDELEGMKERDLTWEMGVRLGLRGPRKVDVGFGALTDVLGRHDGQEYVADISRAFTHKSWRFTPALSVTVLSDKLADYYYGVSPDEERLPVRPAYKPATAWVVTPSVRVLSERWYPWVFSASVGVEYLGPEIADSPIVANRTPLTGFVAISRQFGPGARDR